MGANTTTRRAYKLAKTVAKLMSLMSSFSPPYSGVYIATPCRISQSGVPPLYKIYKIVPSVIHGIAAIQLLFVNAPNRTPVTGIKIVKGPYTGVMAVFVKYIASPPIKAAMIAYSKSNRYAITGKIKMLAVISASPPIYTLIGK